MKAEHDLGQGAINGSQHLIGEVVGRFEHQLARTEVVVFGKSPGKIGVLLAGAGQGYQGLGACRWAAMEADIALAAGLEIAIYHSVAFLQGLTRRVGADAGP
jgi:hypothetical protein